MKVKVNEKCIGCGACVSLTESRIFDFNDNGQAECIVDTIEKDDKELVEQAIKFCPTGAIEKTK